MKNNSQITICVVEDNEIFRQTLKVNIETSFAKLDLNVLGFASGESCMKEFSTLSPEIVIIDYHLNSTQPEAADGVRIMDLMKKLNPDVQVILLTSEDDINIALKSFRHGASDYVVKSESKFAKINHSLFNIIRIVKANREVKRYKTVALVLGIAVTLLVGAGIAVQLYNPSNL